jgi:hypothetical protein
MSLLTETDSRWTVIEVLEGDAEIAAAFERVCGRIDEWVEQALAGQYAHSF